MNQPLKRVAGSKETCGVSQRDSAESRGHLSHARPGTAAWGGSAKGLPSSAISDRWASGTGPGDRGAECSPHPGWKQGDMGGTRTGPQGSPPDSQRYHLRKEVPVYPGQGAAPLFTELLGQWA